MPDTINVVPNASFYIHHQWKYESIELQAYSGRNDDERYMKRLIDVAPAMYGCKRPPGAAGAILVAASSVIECGVSPPTGSPNCLAYGCDIVDGHCIRCIHAERRAIITAARYGITTANAIMYSVLKPCYECTKHIIDAGIHKVMYTGVAYDEDRTRQIIKNAQLYGDTPITFEYIAIGLNYGKLQ